MITLWLCLGDKLSVSLGQKRTAEVTVKVSLLITISKRNPSRTYCCRLLSFIVINDAIVIVPVSLKYRFIVLAITSSRCH